MDTCLTCGKPFTRLKPNQRFCPGGKCRSIWHNREKGKGLMLTPDIRKELQELASAHEITENEMAVRMYRQWQNPEKGPVTDAEAFGINKAET